VREVAVTAMQKLYQTLIGAALGLASAWVFLFALDWVLVHR
jgi:hypothetical protein